MPIENERKFVLDDDGKLEARLVQVPGVTRSLLKQAYLDAPGLRIRSIETDGRRAHVFTYKREIEGQVVEIETDIVASDFDRLWTQRREIALQDALFLAGRAFPLGRRFLQDRGRPDLLRHGRGRDAGERHDAAAALGPAGEPLPGRRAASRPALHVQALVGSRVCRETAGRHPHEGQSGMKIARIDSHSVKVPFTFGGNPTGYGGRNWTTNNILLVRVETDTGLVGWGEAFCYGCTDAVRAALEHMIAPIAIGRDAGDIGRLSRDLQQMLHLFGRYGITTFALSGLDIALWDIAGKAANLPLHRLLGGAGRDSLPAYASLLKYRDPERVAARVSQASGRAIATSSCTRPKRPRSRRRARRQATTWRSWSTPTARGRPSRRAS